MITWRREGEVASIGDVVVMISQSGVAICYMRNSGQVPMLCSSLYLTRTPPALGHTAGAYRYIIYAPNLGLGIAVSVQKGTRAALEGAAREHGEAVREHGEATRGAGGQQMGASNGSTEARL